MPPASPRCKPLDTLRLRRRRGIDANLRSSSSRAASGSRRRKLLLAGPIGTGKTHLAIALGIEARAAPPRAFWRAADLVRTLLEARDARELTRLQRRLHASTLLIVDELGFVPFDRTGGELLFNLLTARYERRPRSSPRNLAFSEWAPSLPATRS